MNYWLVKSDPDTYGWPEMKKDKETFWDGVRNYAARKNMNAMQKGDLVLFYHSQSDKTVVGVTKVVKESYQDPTTEDERWVAVDLAYESEFKTPVTLADIKATPKLQDIALVRQSRLSVMPLSKAEYDLIVKMGNE